MRLLLAEIRMTNLIHSFWLFLILFVCGLGLSFLGVALQHDGHFFPDRGTIVILTSPGER